MSEIVEQWEWFKKVALILVKRSSRTESNKTENKMLVRDKIWIKIHDNSVNLKISKLHENNKDDPNKAYKVIGQIIFRCNS